MAKVKVKEFRLRPGFSHYHNGEAVGEGDTVFLQQAQAHAFRDRFEPVGDGDFEEKEEDDVRYDPSKSKSAKSKEKGAKDEKTGPTKEAPQGQPPPQPAIHAEQGTGSVGPADYNALDPAKQGQQSREQRAIIDAGKAPVAAVNLGEAERKKALEEQSGKESKGAPAAATAKV